MTKSMTATITGLVLAVGLFAQQPKTLALINVDWGGGVSVIQFDNPRTTGAQAKQIDNRHTLQVQFFGNKKAEVKVTEIGKEAAPYPATVVIIKSGGGRTIYLVSPDKDTKQQFADDMNRALEHIDRFQLWP